MGKITRHLSLLIQICGLDHQQICILTNFPQVGRSARVANMNKASSRACRTEHLVRENRTPIRELDRLTINQLPSPGTWGDFQLFCLLWQKWAARFLFKEITKAVRAAMADRECGD